jgi:sulfate transport system permease protein
MAHLSSPGRKRVRRSVLPGFGLTLGFSMLYLSIIVLLPLSTVFVKSAGMGPEAFAHAAFNTRTLLAYKLSFGAAAAAAAINMVAGLLVAWILVRYEFPGKRLLSAMVDLPFALPTAVAGIALTALYADKGLIGAWLAPLGIKIAYTPIGIVFALIFIGLPFVVRSVEPVLADVGPDVEEAAASLGAGRFTTFWRVILPAVAPALITGFALAFARGIGEYGSIIFIAGNMPFHTEIAPLRIVQHLEEFDYAGATAIAAVMLIISFGMLLVINLVQVWSRRRMA